MNLIATIALCGAMLGALLATALRLVHGRNRIANDILALFVLVFSIHLLLLAPLLNHHQFNSSVYPLFLNDVFLFGPLLYFYVRAMTEPNFHLRPIDLLHLLPVVLFVCVGLLLNRAHASIFVVLNSAAARGWPPSPAALLGMSFYFSFSIYLMLSLRRLRRHACVVYQQFSWLEGVNLRWLRILVRASLALSLIGLTFCIARLFIDLTFWPRGAYSMLMMIALFHLIAFMAIWQPAIFHAATPAASSVPSLTPSLDVVVPQSDPPLAIASSEAAPKYETSALSAEQVQAAWLRLLTFMEQHKPYLDNELRLAQLASSFGMPAHHLSQIINQGAGQHFLEFINGYRIEEAKRLLMHSDNRDKKMVALALEAGFNSQSAFYKQFRKQVGVTPQQYRAQAQAAPDAVAAVVGR